MSRSIVAEVRRVPPFARIDAVVLFLVVADMVIKPAATTTTGSCWRWRRSSSLASA